MFFPLPRLHVLDVVGLSIVRRISLGVWLRFWCDGVGGFASWSPGRGTAGH